MPCGNVPCRPTCSWNAADAARRQLISLGQRSSGDGEFRDASESVYACVYVCIYVCECKYVCVCMFVYECDASLSCT